MSSGLKKENELVSTLEIKAQGLAACVGGNFLSVPKYQRAFSWEDENVSNFLADINSAFSDGSPEYFMGSVVLQGADQKYEVVDGQQRLTTATILVSASRDFVKETLIYPGRPRWPGGARGGKILA